MVCVPKNAQRRTPKRRDLAIGEVGGGRELTTAGRARQGAWGRLGVEGVERTE